MGGASEVFWCTPLQKHALLRKGIVCAPVIFTLLCVKYACLFTDVHPPGRRAKDFEGKPHEGRC